MLNGLGVVIGGIFLGAVGTEIVRRNFPGAIDTLYMKARRVTSGMDEAFKRGYQSAISSQEMAASD